ncbi:MAG: prepilin-type N-terminal cleavage/methylation domain-containing protein [Gemmatimonadaceae bacterium]|nr:prepilin-type N-terminal cleavage/methylation domain-containing protein [Gemmatimonadaceae bacterium]
MRRRRTGFTLVEVVLALAILGGSLLGLARFTREFTRASSDASRRTLANDLATARIEEIKGWRIYGTIVATYHNITETYGTASAYNGLVRQTWAVRTGPNATHDYITITVEVRGRGITTAIRTTTIIANF